MKTLDTLVEDIHGLFDAPHQCDDKRVEELGQALAIKIAERLMEVRDGQSYLRMSNLGKGDRQLWYDIKEPGDSEKLNASAKIKFLFGDILELLLIFFAEEAGHDVQHKQEVVTVDGVKGSADCTIDGVPIDCKSASSYSFRKFKTNQVHEDDPFGYMEQLAGYTEGLGRGNGGAFLAIDKTLGHIALARYSQEELDAYRVRDRITHIKEVLDGDIIPDRCYPAVPEGASGNETLGVNCSYCPHRFRCWADANDGIGLRTFLYSNGPKHLTKVVKEPRVMEITF